MNHSREQEGWCGPATIQNVAELMGIRVTQSQLAEFMGTTNKVATAYKTPTISTEIG